MSTDLPNVPHNTFSVLLHHVRLEASLSVGEEFGGWRQSKTTGDTVCERVILWQYAGPIEWILAGNELALDTLNTENDLQMQREAEECNFAQNGQEL
jgi:hypothetical protein